MSDSVPIFDGILKDGKPKVLGRERYKFDKYLRMIPDGTFLDIIIRKHEETVSDPLRKYYWAVVAQMIADHVGHSKEAIHEALKLKFSSYVDEKTGLTIIESVFSNESEIAVSKKKVFIQNVRAWASDFLDMQIPEPNEAYYD
jgi:hypothetical protein